LSAQRRSLPLACLVLAVALVTAACSGGGKAATSSSTTTTAKDKTHTDTSGDASAAGGGGKGCATPQKASDMTATAKELQAANGAAPRVQAVIYPHPDYQAKLWSQWGQGVALPDGRFFSAVGDHCGINGNAYFYEYSPDSGRLRMLSDVDSAVGHNDGAWGYGKIHAQMGLGPDGKLYAATCCCASTPGLAPSPSSPCRRPSTASRP
jgi:hypothetical protein